MRETSPMRGRFWLGARVQVLTGGGDSAVGWVSGKSSWGSSQASRKRRMMTASGVCCETNSGVGGDLGEVGIWRCSSRSVSAMVREGGDDGGSWVGKVLELLVTVETLEDGGDTSVVVKGEFGVGVSGSLFWRCCSRCSWTWLSLSVILHMEQRYAIFRI